MHQKKSILFALFLIILIVFFQGCRVENQSDKTSVINSQSAQILNAFPVSLEQFEKRVQQRKAVGDTFPVKPSFLKSCLASAVEGYEISGDDSLYSFTSDLKLSEFFRRYTSKKETSIDIKITDLVHRKNLVESEINLFNSGQNEFEETEQQFHAPPDSFTIFWTWENPSTFLYGLSAIVDFRFRISIVAEGNGMGNIPQKIFTSLKREILLHPPAAGPKNEIKKAETLPKKRKRKK